MEPIHDGECIEDGASMYEYYVVYISLEIV